MEDIHPHNNLHQLPTIDTNHQDDDFFNYPNSNIAEIDDLHAGDLFWMPVEYNDVNRGKTQEYRMFMMIQAPSSRNNYDITVVPATTKQSNDPTLNQFEVPFKNNYGQDCYLKTNRTCKIHAYDFPDAVNFDHHDTRLFNQYRETHTHMVRKVKQNRNYLASQTYDADYVLSKDQNQLVYQKRKHYGVNLDMPKAEPINPLRPSMFEDGQRKYNVKQMSYLLGIPKDKRNRKACKAIEQQDYQQLDRIYKQQPCMPKNHKPKKNTDTYHQHHKKHRQKHNQHELEL